MWKYCCLHLGAVERQYVGSKEVYAYCSSCFQTWGGEETPTKKRLIHEAALALVGEEDEPSGYQKKHQGSQVDP